MQGLSIESWVLGYAVISLSHTIAQVDLGQWTVGSK